MLPPLPNLLIHVFTHELIYHPIYLFIHLLTHPPFLPWTHSFTPLLFIFSITHSLIPSLICPLTHSFIHLSIAQGLPGGLCFGMGDK